MKIFVGLGNPGAQYKNTRHNIGFMVVDKMRAYFNFDCERKKFEGALSEGRIANQKAIIFKPQNFMNLSGQAVGAVSRYFNVAVEDVIVFYDELDLPLGKLRARIGGSASGHNGVKSCISHLGSNFCRIRLGIGHPGDKFLVNNHVLGNFAKNEAGPVENWLEEIAKNIPLLMTSRLDLFTNKIHLAMEALN